MPDIHSALDSLSGEELDALNNDPELLSRFKAKYSAPQPQGLVSKAADILGTPGRGVAALAYGAGQIGGQHSPQEVLNTMSDITKPGFQPKDTAESAANVAGTLTNLAVPVGAAGKVIGAGLDATGLAPKAAAIGKGLVSSTGALGQAIAKTEQNAGLVTDAVVSIPKGGQGLTKALQDIKDTGDLVKSGLTQDTPEFAQQLKSYYDKAAGILDQGPKAIGKKNYALAAQAKAAINDALNSVIPGRDDAQLASKAAYVRNAALGTGIILKGGNYVKNAITGALGQ